MLSTVARYLDPDRFSGAGHPAADHTPVKTPYDRCLDAARQLAGILDLGHGSDARVALLDLGNEQGQAVALSGRRQCRPGLGVVDRQRHHHVREHHPGRKWDEGKRSNL